MALTTDDKVAIAELLARYTHAIDFGEWSLFDTVFASDATFEVPAMDVSVTGIDALQTFFRQSHAENPSVRHVTTNSVSDGDSTRARARSYLQVIDSSTQTIVSSGVYHDTLVRTAGGWRLQSRLVELP